MTFALAWDPFRQLGLLLPPGLLREMATALLSLYLPLLILLFLGGLCYREWAQPQKQVSSSETLISVSGNPRG
jgi:hypothetical protein